MITEDYCSYETAKLLKDKGFNEPCFYYYKDKVLMFSPFLKGRNSYQTDTYSAPTHQMVMKWLREVHNKHCDIGYDLDLYWFFQIIELKELIEHFEYSELKYYHAENETGFNSYEEAVEAALKYCLENLI